MPEQENKRALHLIILIVCTILEALLTLETVLMGWEIGAVILLLIALMVSWILHATEKLGGKARIWLYFIQTMLALFFYGIHETSIFDLAPLMIVVIFLFSLAEKPLLGDLAVACFCFIMAYDYIFVVGGKADLNALTISRAVFHFVLVFMADFITRFMINYSKKEKNDANKTIKQLEEVNRRCEDFLTNVSHELRTPINAVTGITSVMLKTEEDAEKLKDIIAVQTAGRRLFDRIDDILDYTEISTRRLTITGEPYMISSVINDIVIENQSSDMEKALEIIFDIDPRIPASLIGDAKKIKKIIRHILDNSIKFTKRGGIYVNVYAVPKSYGVNLCIRVDDTGVGISEENLSKIKEKFFQSNTGRNRSSGGLGLGLSIVYGMVAAMEGFVQTESSPNNGTEVRISIPQKIADSSPVMSLENRGELCVGCFLRPEKYDAPAVRDYYNKMITNMIRGFDIPLHRVFNMDEMKKLTSMYQLTHLFIGKEEYEDNERFFEELCRSTMVIVSADKSFSAPPSSNIKILRKPFAGMSVISLLNSNSDDGKAFVRSRMICPGLKVLVVDDEPMNLMVAQGIFSGYQMTAKTAQSGMEAIKICENEDFDLIFLDHMMPEMDGVETLKRLRRIDRENGRELTVIAFTANAVSGAREMFLHEGFDEFVSKPVEEQELERVLRKVLPKNAIQYVDEKSLKKKRNAKPAPLPVPEEEQSVANASAEKPDTEEDTLQEIPNVDRRSAMKYCGNDMDFYVNLLEAFAASGEQKLKEIADAFDKEDYDNYRIRVHALKSSAKTIGADSLSENARLAEFAAKDNDVGYIKEHTAALMDEYKKLLNDIRSAVGHGGESESGEPESGVSESAESSVEETSASLSAEELAERLTELKNVLDTFEAEKAVELIGEMSGLSYGGEPLEPLMNAIKSDVEEFEFSAASEKASELLMKTKDDKSEADKASDGISKEELTERLTELKNVLETFEAEKANELIAGMSVLSYNGSPLEPLLSAIRNDINDFELSAAAEKTSELLENTKGGES